MNYDKNPLGRLIKFSSPNGRLLHGLFYEESKNNIAVIHVHGSYGNFYQNDFIPIMAQKYLENNINFLTFNLTGHDGISEGQYIKDNKKYWDYIGFSVVDFDTCLDDIRGAIAYVRGFCQCVFLQGHSMGCDRILHLLIEDGMQNNIILLSPTDSYALQTKWLCGASIKSQIETIETGTNEKNRLFDWLDESAFGVGKPYDLLDGIVDESPYIPMTREAFLSILNGAPFKLINLSKPSQFYLNVKCFVYLGGNDVYQTASHLELLNYLAGRVNEITPAYYPQGDHSFSGLEIDVLESIIIWIRKKVFNDE